MAWNHYRCFMESIITCLLFEFFLDWCLCCRDDESRSEDDSEIYTSIKPNIEELEMLLEAYFAQIDGILQKLSDVSISAASPIYDLKPHWS